eukprot:scaffold8930_cov95-Isochrysis_galbana.AAC.3
MDQYMQHRIQVEPPQLQRLPCLWTQVLGNWQAAGLDPQLVGAGQGRAAFNLLVHQPADDINNIWVDGVERGRGVGTQIDEGGGGAGQGEGAGRAVGDTPSQESCDIGGGRRGGASGQSNCETGRGLTPSQGCPAREMSATSGSSVPRTTPGELSVELRSEPSLALRGTPCLELRSSACTRRFPAPVSHPSPPPEQSPPHLEPPPPV